MNRVISWLQNYLLRVILTLSLVVITFLFNAALGDNNSVQAQAESLTPEATEYKIDSQDSPFHTEQQKKVNKLFKENKNPQEASETTEQIGKNLTKPAKTTKKTIKNTVDNIQEKLNGD
jgi:predicted PurR-regulated permease PerM